jgi:hypothetical protein
VCNVCHTSVLFDLCRACVSSYDSVNVSRESNSFACTSYRTADIRRRVSTHVAVDASCVLSFSRFAMRVEMS